MQSSGEVWWLDQTCQQYLLMTYGKPLLCPPVVDDPVEVSKNLPRTHLYVIIKAEILLH